MVRLKVRGAGVAVGARRRDFLVGMGAAAGSIAVPVLAQGRTLRLASVLPLSGSEHATGKALSQGALACFNALNKAGGIHGSKLELLTSDDQFKPKLTKAQVQAFAADKSVLGLLAPTGTRQAVATWEGAVDMAIVGPFTGTANLRKTSPPNVFWVRATYADEIDKLIQNALTVGLTKIGIVYPLDPFGQAALEPFEKSLAAFNLKPSVIVTIPSTGSTEVDAAVQAVVKAEPQLVLAIMAGVTPVFVKALRKAGGNCSLYCLSVMANSATIERLGDQGRGIGFATVVPSPFSPKYDIVRQYRIDMAASGWTDYSLISLEGYVNARVTVEGLRRAGAGVTRESLIAGLEKIDTFDPNCMSIRYGRGNRRGSRFVDLAAIGAGGRISV